jgi:multiple sugar transport system permease protein
MKHKSAKKIFASYSGYLFIAPVMLGILIFTLAPMVLSLYYSFFDYNIVESPVNFGLQNYVKIFTARSADFFQSIRVTLTFSAIVIPLGMVLSFVLALFLNQRLRGIKAFRLLYYLPCIIPGIVGGLLWRDVMNERIGIFNRLLGMLGVPPYPFFNAAETSMTTLVFTTLFGIGGSMLLWLAALSGVSVTLYEAARIDGAGRFARTFRITIPMCGATIFYMVVTGLIGALQTFGGVYVLTGGGGGKDNALLFYVMNVYQAAFGSGMDMGYAGALSWVLFLIIAALTLLLFKTGGWVHYEDD